MSDTKPLHLHRKVLLLSVAMALGACSSIQPQPITSDTLLKQSKTDQQNALNAAPPLNGPLSLEEAMARALKFNLERRTLMMEETIAMNQLDLSRYDMLPQLVAQAAYHDRSEDAVTRSKDSVTGLPSLANPYISSERQHTTADLNLSWNILDFGLSYYSAKQKADQVLIAAEHRRRAMHQLMQNVRSAFWRVASAQKLQNQVNTAITDAEDALQDARQAEEAKIRSPLDALRYQRQVLENLRLLESINQELSTARVELANLINAPLSQALQVVETNESADSPMLTMPVDQLETIAITQNANLREQFYNTRIAQIETRKVMTRLFPSLGFNYSLRCDSDNYLVHQNWNEAGMQLSYNLMNLFTAPIQRKLADAGVALADQRRMATQMAVLAQVHIAQLEYANAYRQFNRADAIWKVDSKIATQIANREDAKTQSKLDVVANNTTAILSLLRRYQSLAQVHAAASKLQSSLGMEPTIGNVQDMELSQLTQQIQISLQQWQKGETTITPAAITKE